MVDVNFTTAITRDTCVFVNKWQEAINARLKKLEYNWEQTLSISWGKKYAKIVTEDHGSKSVAGFVDLSNGDILKAASWAKPAKHARGNVSSIWHGMEAIDNNCFVKYLK